MAANRFPRAFVLAVAGAGVAVRLAFGLGYWVNQTLNRDEIEYLSLTRHLTATGVYDFEPELKAGHVQPFGRAPGYPFFLYLIGAGKAPAESVPASVKIAQSIVGGLGVIVIGWAGYRLGGRRSAMAAAALAAFYPPLIWISGYVYSEAVFWPVGISLALIVTHMLTTVGDEKWKWAALSGVATGLAILLRAATMPFAPILIAWLLWKRQFTAIAGVAIGLMLVLGPWTVRNYLHHGRFVLVASDGGVTFWTGNNSLATGEGDMAANPQLKLVNQTLRAHHPTLSEEELEPIYYRESFWWIRTHPLDWLWLMVKKVFYLIVPIGPSYRVHSTRYYLASVLSLALVLPLAVVGGWRLGRHRARLIGMWLLAAAAVATCLVFFPQERFRIPVLDPALILLASGVWFTGSRDLADEAVQQKVA
jgi:4-amino-4-deoxy-L-arabinose transferase-like glycosyltransferase